MKSQKIFGISKNQLHYACRINWNKRKNMNWIRNYFFQSETWLWKASEYGWEKNTNYGVDKKNNSNRTRFKRDSWIKVKVHFIKILDAVYFQFAVPATGADCRLALDFCTRKLNVSSATVGVHHETSTRNSYNPHSPTHMWIYISTYRTVN